jgi:hypothetical protein
MIASPLGSEELNQIIRNTSGLKVRPVDTAVIRVFVYICGGLRLPIGLQGEAGTVSETGKPPSVPIQVASFCNTICELQSW